MGEGDKESQSRSSLAALWVEDLVLSLLWLGSLLGCRFIPWPENIRVLWVWPKKGIEGWMDGERDGGMGEEGKAGGREGGIDLDKAVLDTL